MDYIALGKNIRKARKKRSITQEQLAELCDITPVFVSQIENAMRKPSLETVCCIAHSLKISVDELLGGEKNAADLTNVIRLLENRTSDEIMFSYNVLEEILRNIENGKICLSDNDFE